MNKNDIINNWSYKNLSIHNNLIIKFANEYSKNNNVELIILNLLNEVFNSYFWFICNKTGKLYFLNFDENNKQYINILSEINYFTFTQVIFNNQITETNITVNNLNKNSPRKIRNQRLNILRSVQKLEMISATSIRNYMLNDTLIDYYNITSLKKQKPDIFSEYIMNSGIKFEEELIKLIMEKHSLIKVADFTQSRQIKKFNQTINLMKKGFPIIYQGVLHNNENNTFGLPDLIVRSDYINKLMNYEVIDDKEAMTPSLLGTKFHYKIIDIKHSTIPLRSDGIHILNSESIPAYKGQLYIYTLALNKIQGIKINKAFIWGKRYTYESCNVKYNINNFLNKLAIIDYDNIDIDYIEQTHNAINWIKTLRQDYSTWSLMPIPCRNELFPNMKNDKDGNWHQIKSELSDNINEITQVWNCGYKKRQIAHTKHIFDWRNPKFNSKLLKMNKSKIGQTLDKILNINRQNKDLMRPKKIKYDRENWTNYNGIEFYLDFETFNTNLDSIIKNGKIIDENNQFIFMIGVGYEFNNEWVFKSFIMKNKTLESEKIMFEEFMEYINNIRGNNLCKMYHWSNAEVYSYQNFKTRHLELIINDKHISFYDLNKVFVNEPITIKGALNYSLKTVSKALKKHNLIKSTWNTDSICSNGLNAMILANNLYESNNDVLNDPIMQEIIYYNEIDCKVLWEIHLLIKK